MDLFESIAVDWSFQSVFTGRKLSQEDIQRILEAASWAPSPYNSQPWEFVIVQEREHIKKIASMAAEAVDCSYTDLSRVQIKNYLATSNNILFYLEDTTRQDPGVNAFTLGLLCMGTALSNLVLVASDLRIGIQPITFAPSREDLVSDLRRYLKIPDKFAVRCMLCLGYLKGKNAFIQDGKPTPLIVHDNHYGNRKDTREINSNVSDGNRFSLIKKRSSYRKDYLKRDVTVESENAIIKSARDCFVFNKQRFWELIFIKDKKLIHSIADLIAETAFEIHLDEGYSKKMRAWTRFTQLERSKTTDGVLLVFWSNFMGRVLKGATFLMERFAIFKPLRVLLVKMHSQQFFGDLVRVAPLLVVAVYNEKRLENSDFTYELNTISVGAGIQNMLLAATANEMGAQFLSILVDTENARRRVKELLHLPDDVKVVDLMRLGYIDPSASDKLLTISKTLRRPVKKITHREFYYASF